MLGCTATDRILVLKIYIVNESVVLLFEVKIVHNGQTSLFACCLKLFANHEASIAVENKQLTECVEENVVMLVLSWPGLLQIAKQNRAILMGVFVHCFN